MGPSNLVLKTCGFVLVQILILGNLSLAEKNSAGPVGLFVALMTFLCVCITQAGGRVVAPREDLRDFTLWKILRQTVDEGPGHKSDPLGLTRGTLELLPAASPLMWSEGLDQVSWLRGVCPTIPGGELLGRAPWPSRTLSFTTGVLTRFL